MSKIQLAFVVLMLGGLGLSMIMAPWNLQQYDPLTQGQRVEQAMTFVKVARLAKLDKNERQERWALQKANCFSNPAGAAYLPLFGRDYSVVPEDHPTMIYAPFWAPPQALEASPDPDWEPPHGAYLVYCSYAFTRWIDWGRLALQSGGIVAFGLLGIALAGFRRH